MGKKLTFDFSGWATRNDVKCSDGRTIRKGAFKDNDGQTVPLVWNHNHSAADNVLGHALLENREEGVYAYCSFNETEQGKTAKELVQHGDICSLSIYANQLKQNGGDVIHGAIREVSLVLAGANPGAKIENVIAHGETDSEQAVIWNASDTFKYNVEKEIVEHSEEQKTEPAKTEQKTEPAADDVQHAEGSNTEAEKEETAEDVINTMTEKQQTVLYAFVGAAFEDGKQEGRKEKNQEDTEEMKQNAFESTKTNETENVLTHAELVGAIELAKKTGSLRDAVNQVIADKEAELQHSITNIERLFPEVKAISNTPETINDDTLWVNKVMGKVHHTPFSRVKMMAMDITGDEARARGYIKGNQKEEEVIAALRRETSPQTVYKLQKLDRDDIIDIVDFDVVAYIKQEMRGKLEEEIARAILTGDGRSAASKDKINPLNIRPILGDDTTYVVQKPITKDPNWDQYTFAKYFIKEIIRARKDYKGSGNPTLFTTEDMLTDMLLIEDKNGRVIYDTIEKLKTALRVSDIVTPPYFAEYENLLGILVNLVDYNVGADKGGAVAMFDDFDLNFNKYEYLIETRISGAMVKPHGAITFTLDTTTNNNQPTTQS